MSKIEVNEIVPQSGTTLTLGGSGDTLSIASGVTSSFPSLTVSGDLTVDTNTLYVDSTNNRVFIGTTSTNLGVDAVSTGYYFRDGGQFRAARDQSQPIIGNRLNSDGAILDLRKDGQIIGQLAAQSGGMVINVGSSASEAMRIDSSGNVMIGKTSLDTGVAGFQTYATGAIVSTRASDVCIIAKRLNNDGSNIETFRDGSRTGYIGSNSGSIYIANGSSTAHKGLRFTGTQLKPCTYTGANDDGNYDLGSSTTRFKDAYLSGNLYIGGTGSANALDDYETGTWTPIFIPQSNSFSSITYDYEVRGFYTKIGKLVVAQCFLMTDSISVGSASGYVSIGGLPFTVKIEDNQVDTGGGGIGFSSTFGGDVPSSYYPQRSTTNAFLLYRSSANGDVDLLNVSDLGTGLNSNRLRLSIIYRAD